MLKVSSSTSTNTGVAPTSATTSAVAQKVKVGQITASPRPMPLRHQHQHQRVGAARAGDRMLARRRTPPDRVSSAVTSGPMMNWQWSSTRAIASSIARAEPAALRGDIDERNRR